PRLACVASAFQIAQVGVAEHAAAELVMITQTDTRIVQTASRVLRAHVHVWAELRLGMVQGIFSAKDAAKTRLAERATARRFLHAHGVAVVRMGLLVPLAEFFCRSSFCGNAAVKVARVH